MKTFKNIPSYTLPIVATATSGQAFVSDGYFNCMENEIWKDVKGYEGIYKISNTGKVLSLIFNREKLMTMCFNSHRGYFIFGLSNKGEVKTIPLHRLLAINFIPNPENKPQVNHINGIKTDNRVENLEWATALENSKHAVSMGLTDQKGEKCVYAKLKNRQIYKIRQMRKDGIKYKVIAEKFNIHVRNIFRIISGDTWSHLK